MSEQKDKYNFKDIKQLINVKLYKFIILLLKKIFLQNENRKYSMGCKKHLSDWTEKINGQLIKDKKFQINDKYTIDNLKNIIRFVKTQNRIYASEIVENALILVFSFAFNTSKENTFGKYIYNNLNKFKENNNYEIAGWFNFDEFNSEEFKIDSKDKMEELLKFDENIESKKEKSKEEDEKKEFRKRHPIYDFLSEIHRNIDEEKLFIEENRIKAAKYELDSMFTNYTSINNKGYSPGELGRGNRSSISPLKSFLISVYIYYQNKHSPLMKYYTQKEYKSDLTAIPFIYSFNGATIQPEYAPIIIAPSRIEPRITILDMGYNYLKEKGIIGLSKTLIFNKKIKNFELKRTALKPNYLLYFNEILGLFENNVVEELDMSLNYLKNNSESSLAKILSHLKGLKTINLTSNYLKDGLSSFLIVLKKLYRKKNFNLENLILNNCSLDNSSFYELGELLKSKYCKLKNLYLNLNKIPSNSNFLKKLKKNKSLTEIYINQSNITNVNLDDIMRVISNTNIENLNLYKNKFNNFDDCLKIIYRTKIVVGEGETKKNHEDSSLYNLDISLNDFYSKNLEQIELLKTSLNETSLYILDVSRILCGSEPNEFFYKLKTEPETINDYEKTVLNLKNVLDEEERKYKKNLDDINSYKEDEANLNGFKNSLKDKRFEQLENEITNIIEDDKSIFPLFLKNKAYKLIDEKKEIFNNINDKEKLVDNLVKYMTLKRTEKVLTSLNKEIHKRKLILI